MDISIFTILFHDLYPKELAPRKFTFKKACYIYQKSFSKEKTILSMKYKNKTIIGEWRKLSSKCVND